MIFCFGYGGSLIVLGLITKVFVGKMEKDIATEETETMDEKVGM
ncbi:hypothetical protein QY97_03645 [Bacillus thermotolerans]|uniref:Uncharacterized protein n=1 Tax=Bacillus thermotolerans TaxID=1221996 RepID=A0A0F5HS93_BACTR|nr:hypothetical protein QY97_03645 [Bacillus thermotolerans]KKB34570.1 hypothetical protein QY96_03882 [Bacillus thermotolerans]KKB35905.1 hypothetical protein QY95_03269 [Bacillus thermotolerans]